MITDTEAIEFAKECCLSLYDEEYVWKAPGCFLQVADELLELSSDRRNKHLLIEEGIKRKADLANAFLFYGESWKLRFRASLEANGVPQRVINSIIEALTEEHFNMIEDSKLDLAEIQHLGNLWGAK
jgi:hypothetical protein